MTAITAEQLQELQAHIKLLKADPEQARAYFTAQANAKGEDKGSALANFANRLNQILPTLAELTKQAPAQTALAFNQAPTFTSVASMHAKKEALTAALNPDSGVESKEAKAELNTPHHATGAHI